VITTPVRSQAAWETVTGTFRTITCAPGCPQAARNSAGTADCGLAGELPHALTEKLTENTSAVIAGPARHCARRNLFTIIGRGTPSAGSAA